MADDEGMLRRWHRRKAAARDGTIESAANRLVTEGEPAIPPAARAEVTEPDQSPAAGAALDLPDIDSLDAGSDFSVFMQDGVPEELRRLALRKLWRLDPVLANVDGLVDYGEDFTDAATVIEGLQTAYRVGKGMLSDEEIAARDGDEEGLEETAELAEPGIEEVDSTGENGAEDVPAEADDDPSADHETA